MFRIGEKRDPEADCRYASCADYCRIFQQAMQPLYLLSFLLTANHSTAEQCYVEAFVNVASGNRIFKEWAFSWSKLNLIKNAIRLAFDGGVRNEHPDTWHAAAPRHEIDCLTRLQPLERFVFVMSVLEQYSDRECAMLLNCTVQGVVEARLRALEAIAKSDRTSFQESLTKELPCFVSV
jgi:DNA-directed RNA polymerase specialized sigma24 family protein